jgi:hypothetical protein
MAVSIPGAVKFEEPPLTAEYPQEARRREWGEKYVTPIRRARATLDISLKSINPSKSYEGTVARVQTMPTFRYMNMQVLARVIVAWEDKNGRIKPADMETMADELAGAKDQLTRDKTLFTVKRYVDAVREYMQPRV